MNLSFIKAVGYSLEAKMGCIDYYASLIQIADLLEKVESVMEKTNTRFTVGLVESVSLYIIKQLNKVIIVSEQSHLDHQVIRNCTRTRANDIEVIVLLAKLKELGDPSQLPWQKLGLNRPRRVSDWAKRLDPTAERLPLLNRLGITQ